MAGRGEEEEDGFYMEDLHPIASEYEEIPSFRYLSDSFRWFSWKSQRSLSSSSSEPFPSNSLEGRPADNVKVFTLQELQKATQNFHERNLLATTGFSNFYKGRIAKENSFAFWSRSGLPIGIKKFLPKPESQHAYETELHYLAQLDHPNIVKLIGYCSENKERLLVYEFMQNGSLSYQLSKEHTNSLSWTLRIKIAIQIAEVLSYLHSPQCEIIHQLVNPVGILLDSNFNAKLTAFGLANSIQNSEEKEGPTTKYDIYCFGIVLLVLVSGHSRRLRVSDWRKLHNKTSIREFMDTRLEGQYTEEEAFAVVHLAVRCSESASAPQERPDIQEVLAILKNVQARQEVHSSYML